MFQSLRVPSTTSFAKSLSIAMTLFLCCCFCASAYAEETANVHPFLSETFNVQLGVYLPRRNIFVRVDGSAGGENIGIDFDENLQLSKNDNLFALEFTWRFGEKWSLRSQYFDSSTRKSSVLQEDIEWGDDIIQAGSSVSAGSSQTIKRFFFGRSFDSSPEYDYGVGMGVHWLNTGVFVERDFATDFGDASAVSASGPLPNIGGWFYYSPTAKWLVGGRLDWFEASVGDYAGSIINVGVGANYQFAEHFGIGAKYQIFELAAEIRNKPVWRGRLETKYDGLYLYLSGNW